MVSKFSIIWQILKYKSSPFQKYSWAPFCEINFIVKISPLHMELEKLSGKKTKLAILNSLQLQERGLFCLHLNHNSSRFYLFSILVFSITFSLKKKVLFQVRVENGKHTSNFASYSTRKITTEKSFFFLMYNTSRIKRIREVRMSKKF